MPPRSRPGHRRRREDGAALTFLVLVLLAVTGAGLYWTPKPTTRRHLAETANYLKGELLNIARPVGTSGVGGDAADARVPAPGIIRDIETITGTIDGHELIGRRVDLRVPVIGPAGRIGYWVGPRDNRVLVVIDEGEKPARGRDTTGAVSAIPAAGQIAAVTGVIRPLPRDAAARWTVPEADRLVLDDRTIFIASR